LRKSRHKRFGSLPSTAGFLTRLAYARAQAAGIGLEPLLRKCGLTRRQIIDQRARVDVQDQIKFVDLAADALRDDFLGFHLARDFELRKLGLIHYVLASSQTLGEALHRAERYSSIANEGVSLTYFAGKDVVITLDYVGVARHSDRHQIECWATTLLRSCRQLSGRKLVPTRVKFAHRRVEDASELNEFLGRRAEFGADRDEIAFANATQHLPVVSADPYLNEMLTEYCEEALARRRRGRGMFRARVENEIVPLLPHGEARADEVASKLGVSQRTLARRLSAEGQTFAGVLDRLRSDLADRYLHDADLSVSEIAWLLGYREVSAFTHAFKRWTGKTPRAMRSTRQLGSG
jgi:AraC-like DNA-binding protein